MATNERAGYVSPHGLQTSCAIDLRNQRSAADLYIPVILGGCRGDKTDWEVIVRLSHTHWVVSAWIVCSRFRVNNTVHTCSVCLRKRGRIPQATEQDHSFVPSCASEDRNMSVSKVMPKRNYAETFGPTMDPAHWASRSTTERSGSVAS